MYIIGVQEDFAKTAWSDVWELIPFSRSSRRRLNQIKIVSGSNACTTLTSCAGGRHNMPRPLWPWSLTFWPWKWCPSHVWRGLPLSILVRPLCSRLRPDVRDRHRQTDVREHHRLMSPPRVAGYNKYVFDPDRPNGRLNLTASAYRLFDCILCVAGIVCSVLLPYVGFREFRRSFKR